MKTALSHSQLLAEFESSEFVLKTQQQIAKDFGNFSIEFSTEFLQNALPMDEIILDTEEKIAELMKEGEQRFLQYLYLVDIPEHNFLALTTDPDFLPKMSALILKREAYKVYLRAKFS